MEYTTLGPTGLTVSKLCLGTWRFALEAADGTVETDRATAHRLLDAFSDRGGNFIDTANDYGTGVAERWIGDWLEDRDREDYVIASKCFWSVDSRFDENLSRKNIRAEVEGSLERLGTEYLDVLYLHRWDEDTAIEHTLRTLDTLVRDGLVNHVGISTCKAWELTTALWKAETNGLEPFVVTQPKYSATYRHPVSDYLSVCADQDLAVCPYSPLHGGFLTGKYERDGDQVRMPDGSRGDIDEHFADWYLSSAAWDVLDAVRRVADEVDATPAQVSLRWLIDQPAFTCVPVFGARSVDQVDENLAAIEVSLSDEQFHRIETAYHG